MPPGPIRILLLERERLVRSLLARALAGEPDLFVVGAASDVKDMRAILFRSAEPIDVALVTLNQPNYGAVTLLPEIHAMFPQCRIVALDPSIKLGRRRALAISFGAAVALSTNIEFSELVTVIHKAHAGEALISPNELHGLLRDAARWRASNDAARIKFARLTPRETEILEELGSGFCDKEIAEELRIKPKTVASHVANVLNKLEVTSRLQAALLAIRHDYVDVRDE